MRKRTRSTTGGSSGADRPSHTIDELAALSQVPSRTIRFYQSRGALMPPEIRGRVAHYGAAHVERLKLIAQLQGRGLRIDAIADLLGRIERGEVDLARWLGVEEQVKTPWADDRPRALSAEQLAALPGGDAPARIQELVRARLLERQGDDFVLRSPALFELGMKLEAAGVELQTTARAGEILRRHLTRAVDELVDYFLEEARSGRIHVADPARLFGALRAVGLDSVRVLFALEMERALQKLLEPGPMAALSTAARAGT